MKPQLDDLTSQTSETTLAPASDYVESKDKFCPNLKLLNKIYAIMSVVKMQKTTGLYRLCTVLVRHQHNTLWPV